MSEEKQSLLGDRSSSRRQKKKSRQYTDDTRDVGIEMTQSGSISGGSFAGARRLSSGRPSSGRLTPRLSNAFQNSDVYQIALSWKDICVKVNIPGKRGFPFGQSVPPTQKTILRNITGMAAPGCLLAIMGASGSGKSTLLNVLTQRNTKDYIIEGDMMLNGVELPVGTIKNISAYVQQSDMFMETLTVREQLQFRAMLRMDRKLDREARLRRVDEVIQEMGLSGCSNSRIGAAHGTLKGISGGERKRLSFASEALTNPPVFFCDEPTSSLDTFMAQSIVKTLQNMALKGRAILCTIHQPSSELFAMFNEVLILSEGRVAFMGPSKECLNFFSSQRYPCPSKYNPSDHYIVTLAIKPGEEAECKKKSAAICDAYEKTVQAKTILEHIRDQASDVDVDDHVKLNQVTGESRYSPDLSAQVVNLFWRAWIAQFRDPMIFYVRMAQTLVVALMLGTVYFDMEVNQKSVISINGALYMVMFNSCGTNLFAVLTAFPKEIDLVKREYGSGLYKSLIYFITKSFAELPFFLFTCMMFMCIAYFMIGLDDAFDTFIMAWMIVAIASLASIWLGYSISIVTGDATMAMAAAPPIMIPLILFSGAALNLEDIPDYFKWMKELSFFRNAYQLLMVNQWKDLGDIPCANITDFPPNTTIEEMCSAMACPYRTGQVVLDYNSMKDHKGEDIGQILGIAAGLYLIASIAIVVSTRRARE